jgi:propionyl-CoA carboxylase alpha chain
MRVIADGELRYVTGPDGPLEARMMPRFPLPETETEPGSLTAPMPARVVEVQVEVGARVEAGQSIVLLEAMKMEHRVVADETGTVTTIAVTVGDQLEAGQLLLIIDPAD